MKLSTITESLERKYLSEKVNHENDEVNKVLRRVRKQGINSISDEDKEFLAQNGIQIRPDTLSDSNNARPYFRGKGREFKAYKSQEDVGDSRSLARGKYDVDDPDFSNRKLDVKGWLDKQDYAPLDKWQHKADNEKSKQARSQLAWVKEREERARQRRLENEANIANRLEDKDIYTNYDPNKSWTRDSYDWWNAGDDSYKAGQRERDKIVRQAGKHKRREYATYDESLKED